MKPRRELQLQALLGTARTLTQQVRLALLLRMPWVRRRVWIERAARSVRSGAGSVRSTPVGTVEVADASAVEDPHAIPSEKLPVEKLPVLKLPVQKSPVQKSPVQKSPVLE